MKNISACVSIAVLLLAVGASGQAPASAASHATRYNLKDLGTLGGGNSVPIWVTTSGEVVGYSETGQFDSSGSPIFHAFRWKRDVMSDLGTLGGDYSQALGENEQGLVSGVADVAGGATAHAVLWQRGSMSDLGTLAGPDGFSYAELVNDRHEAVGSSSTTAGTMHAVLWNREMIRDLGTLGGPNSFANGINSRGQIVGWSQSDDVPDPVLGFPLYHAVLWNKDRMINLGTGPGGTGSAAFNINNRTQIVGRFAIRDATVGAVVHAFLWESGRIRDLGVPAGEQDSEANSLNDDGQIVGDSGTGPAETYTPDRALLWRSSRPIDLNTLIPADSGYHLIVAFDVNNHSEIAVLAVQLNSGNVHAVLLTPRFSNVEDSHASTMVPLSNLALGLSENARRLLNVAKRKRVGPGAGIR
jgi:probable HAF family extracellular repeat protein